MTNKIPKNWLEYLSAELGVSLSEKQCGDFSTLLDELEEWNKKFNLISYKTPQELLWRHFADSLACKKALDTLYGARSPLDISAADIGAGAGFPGLPVKITLPGIKMLFVESVAKKCSFIENVILKLSLAGSSVFAGRAEILGQDDAYREKYDITLSRAVSALAPNLEYALPLIKTGGFALVWKYENFSTELPAGEKAAAELGGRFREAVPYKLPESARENFILIFEKTSATPRKYPRRPGMAEKKPL